MIGASAGGLEMFQQFFAQMPPDTGMAFVLIQHLDPNHETLIPELLTKHTSMPVQRVLQPTPAEPNHVYVIPANALLTMHRGTLQVSRPAAGVTDRMPIDFFLRSVAPDQREKLIAILLSGIGTDGTLGMRAVKEHGGITLARLGVAFGGSPGQSFGADDRRSVRRDLSTRFESNWTVAHDRDATSK